MKKKAENYSDKTNRNSNASSLPPLPCLAVVGHVKITFILCDTSVPCNMMLNRLTDGQMVNMRTLSRH